MEIRETHGHVCTDGSIRPSFIEEADGWHIRFDWSGGYSITEDAFATEQEASLACVDWLVDELEVTPDQFVNNWIN
jgi:hypothetical protein